MTFVRKLRISRKLLRNYKRIKRYLHDYSLYTIDIDSCGEREIRSPTAKQRK